MNNLPKKIEPDNIINVVAQIRFESNLPEEARFGAIFNDLLEIYPNHNSLPISNIPPNILKEDKALEFAPIHLFYDKNIKIDFGLKSISVIMESPYAGWKTFREHINNVFTLVLTKLQTTNITRLGLAYIDFYEDINMFDNMKIEIKNHIESIHTSQYMFFARKNNFDFMIDTRSNGMVDDKKGSIVNIDVSKNSDLPNHIVKIMSMFDETHKCAKEIYFEDFISKKYFNTLKVEY